MATIELKLKSPNGLTSGEMEGRYTGGFVPSASATYFFSDNIYKSYKDGVFVVDLEDSSLHLATLKQIDYLAKGDYLFSISDEDKLKIREKLLGLPPQLVLNSITLALPSSIALSEEGNGEFSFSFIVDEEGYVGTNYNIFINTPVGSTSDYERVGNTVTVTLGTFTGSSVEVQVIIDGVSSEPGIISVESTE